MTKRCASGKSFVAAGLVALAVCLPASADAARNAASAKPAAFAPNGVFQSLEFETNATTGIDSWRKFSARLAKEATSYQACDNGEAACPPSIKAWRAKLADWRNLSPRAKLIHVNRWANAAFRYAEDQSNYKAADYWATPAQSLKGRGDCEDYALLKYATLRDLGFAEKNLRIVVVNDLRKGIAHAVLSVRTNEGTFILDNQDARVLRHDSIARYAPIYSINAKSRWVNIATRSLKVRKAAPVMLVASADEMALPAAAAETTHLQPVVLPKLKPLKVSTTTIGQSQSYRLSATAMASLLSMPAATHQTTAATAPNIFSRLSPFAVSLLNRVWPFGQALAGRS